MTESDVVQALEAAGKNAEDRTAICRYAQTMTLADRAHAEIPKSSLVCTTDRGGEKIHPALTAWLALAKASADLGARLGIEVDRTVKPTLGRPVAAVSAPDRVAEPPRLKRVK